MEEAKKRALAAREGIQNPLSDQELDRILQTHGLSHETWNFHGRVNEVLLDHTVFLNPQLDRLDQRWLKGHALGHHLLHVGNCFFYEAQSPSVIDKQEQQAETFAGYLLMGDLDWVPNGTLLTEAAELAGVPYAKLNYWWHLVHPTVEERRFREGFKVLANHLARAASTVLAPAFVSAYAVGVMVLMTDTHLPT